MVQWNQLQALSQAEHHDSGRATYVCICYTFLHLNYTTVRSSSSFIGPPKPYAIPYLPIGACRRRYYGNQRFNCPESNPCPNRYCSTANFIQLLREPDKVLVSRRVNADGVLSTRLQETPMGGVTTTLLDPGLAILIARRSQLCCISSTMLMERIPFAFASRWRRWRRSRDSASC